MTDKQKLRVAEVALDWIFHNIGHSAPCYGEELAMCRAGCEAQIKAKDALWKIRACSEEERTT